MQKEHLKVFILLSEKSNKSWRQMSFIRKRKSRYHSIKDLVRHGIIDKKKFKDILNRQIDFMVDVYSRDPLNQFSDNVVGW